MQHCPKPLLLKIFESFPGMYRFAEFPGFASYLLENHLHDLCVDQLTLSRQHNVPVLKLLTHISDEELILRTKESMTELLLDLQENRAFDFIRKSMERWVADQLEIVGKLEVVAEDLTLISYIRRRSFKKWVPSYASEGEKMMRLNDEIDLFFMGQDTTGINTYINILKENLEKKEHQLLVAQSIAHLGSYEWDIQKDESVSTPELRKIFELKDRQPYEEFLKSVHPDDVEKLQAAINTALQTGNYECEYRYLAPSGEKTLWTIGVVSFENEQPAIMRGTVQDITERKNIERELLEKTLQLERSNESLQQFASVASHDLKEPLRKIATFTDFVLESERDFLSDKATSNLQKVKDSARRMQSMITDILTYSSMEGRDKADTDLQTVFQETIDVLDETIKDKKASITSDQLPTIRADAAQMRQLFQNLFSNALKFSKPDVAPRITVHHTIKHGKELNIPGLSASTPYLQLHVVDNGIGFEEEYAEKIFGLFHRLHSKSTYEGSGLGLSIARRIVENHRGLIKASSHKNEGSRFTIILPLELN